MRGLVGWLGLTGISFFLRIPEDCGLGSSDLGFRTFPLRNLEVALVLEEFEFLLGHDELFVGSFFGQPEEGGFFSLAEEHPSVGGSFSEAGGFSRIG